ncbi:hypothetical protein NCC78_02160 [Micromonospora phytophila]|uniref:hypothetical protein n=1 Tax=Micromonospora phytophila TaxID=709888 RepID=UPI00203039FB|nr:hypothetical protein [Micromonospora phytophila]MCM0673530.1 hypothetical protein [Micromonospora phytophila]
MKTEMDLHEAMGAIAATTPSLEASTIMARGKEHRSRRRALLAAGAAVTVILGFGAALSNLPLASRPPHQSAGPTVAATPSGPVASSAVSPTPAPKPALEPAKRFTKRREKPYNGAYESDIIDKSLPSDYPGGRFLRLIRDPHITTLSDHVDDVTPKHLLVNGVEVRMYLTGSDEGVQQAEWVHNRSFYVLQWQPQPAPYRISESDIQWMIAAAIDGSF